LSKRIITANAGTMAAQPGEIKMPYADSKGIKIFYDTYGHGAPIVFLHPWTTNGYIWYY
jgi:pimeloyl-ACP methyl ester carboxylesterase